MLNFYSKTKDKISGILVALDNIAVSEHARETAQLIRDKLEANIFSLVVVGQFKRGKTTFINALLGQDLLPTAIIPLTSIITIINYGNELRIMAFFENKSQKEIAIDELPFYVTEKYNPKNEKKVDRVEIFFPSPYLKNGVQIIDTPGVASVHEHNTKTTYEYLPHADAAIFLVSVDPPLTRAELHFLRDLKNLVVKTFFIQNKIDTVSKTDWEESLAFSKRIIMEEAGFSEMTIYPLSAKQALEGKNENNQQKIEKSGLPRFEKSLEEFFINEKGEILLKSAVEKINNLINEEMILAELQQKSLQLPFEELENKIAAFKKFIHDSEQEKTDSGRLLAEEVKTLKNETLIEDLDKLKQEKTKWLVAQVEKFSTEHKSDGNAKFAELMDEFIAAQIRDIFGAWRVKEERILKKNIEEVLKRFSDRMYRIFDQIVEFSAELFGITNRQFRMQETLPPEIEFRFQTADQSDMLSMTLNLAKKALPKALAHRLILKEARAKAEMLIDRHCGKARYDFSERLGQLVRNYQLNLTEAVRSRQNDVLKALETGIASKQNAAIETEAQKTRIGDKIKNLKEIKESLQKLIIRL
jgi:GTPase SAR1 family protein